MEMPRRVGRRGHFGTSILRRPLISTEGKTGPGMGAAGDRVELELRRTFCALISLEAFLRQGGLLANVSAALMPAVSQAAWAQRGGGGHQA
jgi:hypothetical protein